MAYTWHSSGRIANLSQHKLGRCEGLRSVALSGHWSTISPPSEAEWSMLVELARQRHFGGDLRSRAGAVNYDYLSQGAFRRYLPPNWDYSQRRERRDTTVPVDQFAPNPWGLYQVHGNAWEWCEDAWHDTYDGAPLDGSAWMQGDDVSHHVLRGGHLLAVPAFVRAASRVHDAADQRNDGYAIRLARML